jgi:hypothetical protein
MQDKQQARLEEIPLQEPLPPRDEKENASMMTIKQGGDESPDKEDRLDNVISPMSGSGQPKGMQKNAS